LAVAEVNDKIYAIGGLSFDAANLEVFSTVEEYDPINDKWTKKADMPTPRGALAVAEVGGKIYAIGGENNNRMGLPTVEEYDTGFRSQSVNPQDKITSTWGNIKSIR
jgi:N-acetylneuraminic acid mutarotase